MSFSTDLQQCLWLAHGYCHAPATQEQALESTPLLQWANAVKLTVMDVAMS